MESKSIKQMILDRDKLNDEIRVKLSCFMEFIGGPKCDPCDLEFEVEGEVLFVLIDGEYHESYPTSLIDNPSREDWDDLVAKRKRESELAKQLAAELREKEFRDKELRTLGYLMEKYPDAARVRLINLLRGTFL